jgi:hypothetical protein
MSDTSDSDSETGNDIISLEDAEKHLDEHPHGHEEPGDTNVQAERQPSDDD